MINAHQFKEAAKKFRAGRISLSEFADLVIDGKPLRPSNQVPRRESASSRFSNRSVTEASGGESDDGGNSDPVNPTAGQHLESLWGQLTTRDPESHKGDFGRVLAIGGSEGMAGAVGLTGLAALRSGAGLVKIAAPQMVQAQVAAWSPCLMTIGCAADGGHFHESMIPSLADHCEWANVVAIGPGMGRGKAQQGIVTRLFHQLPQPMVVDADGLNSLADAKADLKDHVGPRVLTPHPGEFCRLIGQTPETRDLLESRALELARDNNLVIVLKGHRTFITDGHLQFHNTTGNPGMASAGSGDVLTGMIGALIGQGLTPLDAAQLGVHWHGAAGDHAAATVGQVSMIATDLIDSLARAIPESAK